MGFFSSDPVNLSIQLNQPIDQPYYPGAPVTGHALLTSSVEDFATQLFISLIGKTTVDFSVSHGMGDDRRWVGYHEETPLFTLSQTLITTTADGQPQTLLRDRGHRLPFSFTFPERTSMPHALPPSFEHTSQAKCVVEYELRVTLVGEGRRKPIFFAQPVCFLPLRSVEQMQLGMGVGRGFYPFVQDHRIASSALFLPTEMAGKASKRNTLKDLFTSSSSLPWTDITLSASLPQSIVLGTNQILPIFLCLKINKTSDPAIEIPDVLFRVEKVALVNFVAYRALRDDRTFYRPNYAGEEAQLEEHGLKLGVVEEEKVVEKDRGGGRMDEEERGENGFGEEKGKEKYIEKSKENHETFGEKSKVDDERAEGSEFRWTCQVRMPTDVEPAFRSYTICSSWMVQGKIEVIVKGKSKELKFETPGFEIVSPFGDR
ncbi:hypothetical protein K402DRAFT_425446 [Aulographum hederae CBS 113979]|uniref:Arrestin-like N-terminal domain-containing protein n=1 Tax=Aulographum hederae CBS 113979 TaxID=1176131 RepID=A0A6G1GKL9_9PEZI|nr:hypothetical protein K402DRAFT_425446 [Aulographum hederae CBS 113979]